MNAKIDGELLDKKRRLIDRINRYDSLGVAFSGGVDSTYLLAVALEQLGQHVIALTAVSPTHPKQEKEQAIAVAKQIGARQVLFETMELDDTEFTANKPDRCYYCKKNIFSNMRRYAEKQGVNILAHGANMDDLDDYRPGLQAAREMDVQAPLIDAGLAKADIRILAREMGLPNWDRPAMACLATRIPYGVEINVELLRQIEKAERFLGELGLKYSRVRHQGELACIEVEEQYIDSLIQTSIRKQIIHAFRSFGFSRIALDMEGYVSGKMNRGIFEEPKSSAG